jgi:ribosomal protein L34E
MTQTQCSYCERSLRIEIISPFPNLKYIISKRNPTTPYGGMFCSSYCGTSHIKHVESILKRYKFNIKKVRNIQQWWRRITN